MAKLYPPYLEGTLPAFSLTTQGNGVMTIPFVINRAVSYTEILSAKIKVKTVQNDVLLASVRIEDCGGHLEELDTEGNGQITFNIMNWQLYEDEDLFLFKIGQYYKIQLAFIDRQGVEGYYSTVGVIKCTSDPSVSIVGFTEGEINKNLPEFIGEFKQDIQNNGDVTEKVYSSKFEVFYPNGELAYSSGSISHNVQSDNAKLRKSLAYADAEELHNIQNDVNSYTSTDSYAFNRDIPEDTLYTIKYTVTTTNGLVKSSPLYYIGNLQTYDTSVKGDLYAELNYDEGYIELTIDDKTGVEFSNGMYVLSREDSANPGYWEELTKFSINNELVDSMLLFRDFYIEQGKYYTYSLQQYNDNGLYTNRKKSNLVYSDFEDIFLYDGERQLKLRFNPQVNSFKTQLAETRTETIGSKYPFFFRNARIGYKTFPVSGLLSMLSDDNELFVNYDEIMRDVYLNHRHNNDKTKEEPYKFTDLLSKNMTSERLFKMEVLDWLNNGKVKLFKSPAEGNYLVRLMDVSLSPERALGRMLHNVSMTAYECDRLNRENYLKYGILKEIPKEDVVAQIVSIKTKNLDDVIFDNGHSDNLFTSDQVGAFTTILRLIDFKPGTKVELVFNRNGKFIEPNTVNGTNGIIITIGTTGNYIADDITPIYGIYIIDKDNGEGDIFLGANPVISYMGEDSYKNEFNLMDDIHTHIGATRQIIGASQMDVFKNLERLRGKDISKKEKVFYIDQIDIFRRPVKYVYYDGVQFGLDEIGDTVNGLQNVWSSLVTDRNGDEDFGYFSRSTFGDNLYLDLETKPRVPFTHKNMMDYAPFAFYVVKNLSIDGERISNHKVEFDKNSGYSETEGKDMGEHEHQHILEKYFIDRILMASTAEEELISKSLAYLALAQSEDEEEISNEVYNFLEADPLYVIDGWSGRIYKVGIGDNEFIYAPSFVYNDNEISLLELEKYTLNKIKPEDATLFTKNGVYANIYYQKTVTDYSLEKTVVGLNNRKNAINEIISDYKKLPTWEERNVKLDEYEKQYASYADNLAKELEKYFAKE